MNSSPIELEFHCVIFAHHHGYRPVAVSKDVPAGVVETLEASRHHLYFLERRKDEKYRPIKYRFFRLRVEDEEFAVWAKLEAMPDVTTHRGLVSMAQFYLLGGREKEKFESELRANATEVMAKIPFAAIQLGSELRRGERKTLKPLKPEPFAPEPMAKQMLKLRKAAGLEHVQRLLNETVFEALDAEKKVIFHSAGFNDFTDIFNLYCRSLFAALPEVYRRTLSFTTSESTTAIEDYDLVFLHGGAETGAGKAQSGAAFVSLDEPVSDRPLVWYLHDDGLQTDAHDFVSKRLARRNLPAINALKDYYEFLSNPQNQTLVGFTALLEKIEPHLINLDGRIIATDLFGFVKRPSDCSQAVLGSLQRVKENVGKSEKEFWPSPIQYITAWLELLAGTTLRATVEKVIDDFQAQSTKEPFAGEVFAGLRRNKTLRDTFPRLLIFTDGEVAQESEPAQVDDNDDAGKIHGELLINLKREPAASRRLKVDGYSLSLCAPEFKLRFGNLNGSQQNAFFESLLGFVKDARKLEGVLLPVLCTYLQIAPKNLAAADRCFEAMIKYLEDELRNCWRDYEVEEKIVDLCADLKNIPCALNEEKKILPVYASNGRQFLRILSHKECLIMLLGTTQNKSERIDQLIPKLRELGQEKFVELVYLFLEHGIDKASADATRVESLWQEKKERFRSTFTSKI